MSDVQKVQEGIVWVGAVSVMNANWPVECMFHMLILWSL